MLRLLLCSWVRRGWALGIGLRGVDASCDLLVLALTEPSIYPFSSSQPICPKHALPPNPLSASCSVFCYLGLLLVHLAPL